MIADLATWGLAFHAPVCGFMTLVAIKLGGESKFGTQPLEDIKDLRACLLRAITVSLVDIFEPIMTLAITVEAPKLIVPGNDDVETSQRIMKIGSEKLLNAVRDFVMSDCVLMQSLRSLDAARACITRCLRMLRVCAIATAIFSGVAALVSLVITAKIVVIGANWPFVTAFAVVSAWLIFSAFLVVRMMQAVNAFEVLKDRHADLS